jgi:hypothetical protein
MSEHMDRRQTPQNTEIRCMDHEVRITRMEDRIDSNHHKLDSAIKILHKDLKENKQSHSELRDIVVQLVNQSKQIKWILMGAVGAGILSMLLNGEISLFDVAKLL